MNCLQRIGRAALTDEVVTPRQRGGRQAQFSKHNHARLTFALDFVDPAFIWKLRSPVLGLSLLILNWIDVAVRSTTLWRGL